MANGIGRGWPRKMETMARPSAPGSMRISGFHAVTARLLQHGGSVEAVYVDARRDDARHVDREGEAGRDREQRCAVLASGRFRLERRDIVANKHGSHGCKECDLDDEPRVLVNQYCHVFLALGLRLWALGMPERHTLLRTRIPAKA